MTLTAGTVSTNNCTHRNQWHIKIVWFIFKRKYWVCRDCGEHGRRK